MWRPYEEWPRRGCLTCRQTRRQAAHRARISPRKSRSVYLSPMCDTRLPPLCPIIDVNNCIHILRFQKTRAHLSYYYAAITRQGGPRGRRFRTAEPFCGERSFLGSRVAPGSSGRAVTTTRRLLSATEKNLPPQTHLRLSQLE